jgi:D-threonate/D-erythronate kinase
VTAFVIAADDRTGALETAGACADLGCDAVVVPHGIDTPLERGCVVVDLASRHLSPLDAGARAASIGPSAAHKIDSTLRGNWAHELVARQRATGRAVLVVPAFPAAGRTCVDGVVLVDGVPVAEGHAASDVRSPVRSSRPVDHLRDAGASGVDSLRPDTVEGWFVSPSAPFAVCDAATPEDLDTVAKVWSQAPDVVLAGTAAMIAAAAALVSAIGRRGPRTRPVCAAPVLIVCGSLHPMARAQVAAVEAAGASVLLASSREDDYASAIAESLGSAARDALVGGAYRTVMVVGGDTAAAVLGDHVVQVGGTLAPGVAWCRPWGDAGALLLSKPGGFGTPSTLVDLLEERGP